MPIAFAIHIFRVHAVLSPRRAIEWRLRPWIFGDVDAEASDAVFLFGRDGKPLYTPGSDDLAPLIRSRVEELRKHLGDEGFGWESAA